MKNVIISQQKDIDLYLHEKISLVIKMIYSRRLQYLRERNGLTQSEAGKIIHLDSGTYSNYEKEVLLIPIKHLVTYANYYNVSIDYLFDFQELTNYPASKELANKKLSGLRLKEFRKENKITQDKLAKILNASRSTIAEYERGTNLIATPFLYTICKKYSISADYLLGKIDEPKYLK